MSKIKIIAILLVVLFVVTVTAGAVSATCTLCKAKAPDAAFITSVSGRTVKFTDKSTGSPTSYLWDFGDKSTSTPMNPSYTYSEAGTLTASLTVKNKAGIYGGGGPGIV
jgi:PKD repeat protein